jgi:hypothetical protein
LRRREDGEGDGGVLGLAEFMVAAAGVDPGHGERLAGLEHDAVGLFLAVRERLPLIEAVGENEAVAPSKAGTEHGLLVGAARAADIAVAAYAAEDSKRFGNRQ